MSKKKSGGNKKVSWGGCLVAAFVLSKIFHFTVPGIAVGIAIGLGVGKVLNIMTTKLDTTTHNKGEDERRAREAEEAARREAERLQKEEEAKQQEAERLRREAAAQIPLTGNPQADAVITKGLEMLKTIKAENDAIPDEALSRQMDLLCNKCEQIFRSVSEAPEKAGQVRKFMSYYLPTTLKLLANYRTMQQRGVSFQDLSSARATTGRGLDMVLTACQKQIDALHKENMMDINTDIDVLEQMLKRDGYADSDFVMREPEAKAEADVSQARTAAEAQIRSTGAPIMHFPDSENNETRDKAYSHYRL